MKAAMTWVSEWRVTLNKPMLLVPGLIAALLLMPVLLIAAEAQSDDSQEPVVDIQDPENERPDLTEPPPDSGLTLEEDNAGEEGNEDFVPSIRIVEDLPVAFPVDI